jgi:TolB-like protein
VQLGWQLRKNSIAVLPFENRSEDKGKRLLCRTAFRTRFLTRLSKIADLKVISHTYVTQLINKARPKNLPEIARQLGVAHIVEGSVQKSGDAVRVNVQLIKAANDFSSLG